MGEKKKKGDSNSETHEREIYERFTLKKHNVVQVPIETLDASIREAEEKLRGMDVQRDVWLKNPLDNDPSYSLCFSVLQDPHGVIMVQQVAGESLRLLEAPRFLKQGAVQLLDELVEYVIVTAKESWV